MARREPEMVPQNLLPQHQNFSPKPVSKSVVRAAAGAGTHGVITRLVPRDRQPVGLLLGLFLGIGLSTANEPLLQAVGHGVLLGTATSTVNFFWSSVPQSAY